MPRSVMAATIWSDSACLTRGSLAPCPISSGRTIRSTRDSGERSASNRFPSAVELSPTRVRSIPSIGFQYGGTESSRVFRLDGPTKSTPHANTSGVNVSPTRVANPP